MLFQNVKIREKNAKDKSEFVRSALAKIFACFGLVFFALIFNSCRAAKVDLRAIAPAEAIIYLETNDLGKVLKSLTASRAFQEIARQTPDFSALENVRMAIAVTSFETSENKITGENSVLNFTPRFVAVAETDFWQWQTHALVESQFDKFVRSNYGAETVFERSERWDGKFFTWSSKDGRKVFAFVKSRRIYFGNDAAAIERCALRSDKSEVAADAKLPERAAFFGSENSLIFGYVSPEGIRQIADLAGVSVAAETSEAAAQSFIARLLPPILQNNVREIVWTATRNERGIEDNYRVYLKPETAKTTGETLAIANSTFDSFNFLPADFQTATRYNLKNPLIAWRSLLFLTAENTDAASGNLLMRFSGALLEPYGVADAEKFLSAIESEIITVQFDESGERSAAIFTAANAATLKNSIVREIDFSLPPTAQTGAAIWFSDDGQTAAALIENKFIIGDTESVSKCLSAKASGENFTNSRDFREFSQSRHVAVTIGRDTDSANKIVEVLALKKEENRRLATFYRTETKFTETGFERETISDFGLLGTILKQMRR